MIVKEAMGKDYLEYNEKYKDFNDAFSNFQFKSKTQTTYYSYEAYKDLKIIISLYAVIYDFKGFKSLELTSEKFQKLLQGFNCFQKKELLSFFLKKLSDHGHDHNDSSFFTMLQKEEIKCSWIEVMDGNKVVENFVRLILKLSSFNLYTLSMTLFLLFFVIALVIAPAPLPEMEILEIEKSEISQNKFINHISNLLLYMFGVEGHMSISPSNFWGVLLIVTMKIILILVIGNFLIKEILKKIKFL